MRKPRTARLFVARSDVVRHRDRIRGGRMVLGYENAEAIFQLVLRKLDALCRREWNEQGQERNQQQWNSRRASRGRLEAPCEDSCFHFVFSIQAMQSMRLRCITSSD